MKVCSVEGCTTKSRALGMCRKHYEQVRRYGEVKRSRLEPNEIRVKEGYAEIVLYDKQGEEKAVTLISLESVFLVSPYKWHLNKHNYVHGYVEGYQVKLHRFLIHANEDDIVDPKNTNRLDNQLNNLRCVTPSQNSMNRKVKGVSYRAKENKYYARIMIQGKSISLGYFDSQDLAIQARKEAEIKYFKEYRYKEM